MVSYLQELLDIPHISVFNWTSFHVEVAFSWSDRSGALLDDDLTGKKNMSSTLVSLDILSVLLQTCWI